MMCTRCGSYEIVVETEDYAYCDPCERDFQYAMSVEFPFGQCAQCGAPYQQATCRQGKKHTFALHVEGMCSNWSDSGDLSDEDVARGYCDFGCAPAAPVRNLSYELANIEELPF